MSKLLGITDEISTCECCGKKNLKRVAVIELDDGSIVHYGRDCAARELGKQMGINIDVLAEIKAYVQKWPNCTPEKMEQAIWNKWGLYTKYQDGHYHINKTGVV